MIKNLIKRTERTRNFIVPLIIKHLTPSLYTKIEPLIKDTWAVVPRPSIKVMKKVFNLSLVKGVEVGVDMGLNAKSILTELNVEKLYLVDAWINYKGFNGDDKNIEKKHEFVLNEFKEDKRIEIIRELSINAIKKIDDGSLDFAYIDANHLFEYVYQDIDLWTKKVKEGGIIAGHDIIKHSGVLKAVKKYCIENDFVFNIELPDWYFKK